MWLELFFNDRSVPLFRTDVCDVVLGLGTSVQKRQRPEGDPIHHLNGDLFLLR